MRWPCPARAPTTGAAAVLRSAPRRGVRVLHQMYSLIDGIFPRPKLPRMLLRRFLPPSSACLLCVALVTALGCERRSPASRTDTVMPQPETRPASARSNGSASGWPEAAGVALLVQGETRDEALCSSRQGQTMARRRHTWIR